MVLIPDYFRGSWQDPRQPGVPEFLRKHTQWDNLKRDYLDRIKPYAVRHGAKQFAAVGKSEKGSYVTLSKHQFP